MKRKILTEFQFSLFKEYLLSFTSFVSEVTSQSMNLTPTLQRILWNFNSTIIDSNQRLGRPREVELARRNSKWLTWFGRSLKTVFFINLAGRRELPLDQSITDVQGVGGGSCSAAQNGGHVNDRKGLWPLQVLSESSINTNLRHSFSHYAIHKKTEWCHLCLVQFSWMVFDPSPKMLNLVILVSNSIIRDFKKNNNNTLKSKITTKPLILDICETFKFDETVFNRSIIMLKMHWHLTTWHLNTWHLL